MVTHCQPKDTAWLLTAQQFHLTLASPSLCRGRSPIGAGLLLDRLEVLSASGDLDIVGILKVRVGFVVKVGVELVPVGGFGGLQGAKM